MRLLVVEDETKTGDILKNIKVSEYQGGRVVDQTP